MCIDKQQPLYYNLDITKNGGDFVTLEEMLECEKQRYWVVEQFMRAMVKRYGKIRGLPDTPSDAEIKSHLEACRCYYEKFGTTNGEYSPWTWEGESSASEKL